MGGIPLLTYHYSFISDNPCDSWFLEAYTAELLSLYKWGGIYTFHEAPVNDILVSVPESISSKTRAGGSLLSLCHYFIVIICYIYTVDVGYKNIPGSKRICSYNRNKVYSKYEDCFPEDCSYIRNVLITGVHNRHPLYYDTIGYNDIE